jgi:hypothetical protein
MEIEKRWSRFMGPNFFAAGKEMEIQSQYIASILSMDFVYNLALTASFTLTGGKFP